MKLANTVLLALSYTAVDVTEVIQEIVNWLCWVILIIGFIYGGFEAITGHMHQDPGKRLHGIIALVIGVSGAGLLYTICQLII